ncbi:MAG: hypothetical protein WBN13_08135 [Robiginitalea sp.]|uniref:hypothetical protein n=1 Tax=Robiginitalea sp. TaxID=1902411 RepID=UPI003C78A7A6
MKDKKFQGMLNPEWQYRANPIANDGRSSLYRDTFGSVFGVFFQDFDDAVDSNLGQIPLKSLEDY